jgi:hypothetical protein
MLIMQYLEHSTNSYAYLHSMTSANAAFHDKVFDSPVTQNTDNRKRDYPTRLR